MYATIGYIVPEYYKFPGYRGAMDDDNVHGVAPWATGEPWHLKYPAFHAGMCARELCPCFDNRFVQGFRIAHLQTCELVLFFDALDARLIHALFGECPFAAGFRSFLLMLFASAVLLLEGRNVILSPLGSNPGRLTDSPLAGALVSLGVCAMGILNVPVWSTVTFFSGACTMVFSFSWFDP